MPLDNAPMKRGRSPKWRCPECVKEFRKTRMYRVCSFHPGTREFKTSGYGCAAASKLRWILRQNGVQAGHDELLSSVRAYSIAVDEEWRLLGVWIAGHAKTVLMSVTNGSMFTPITWEQTAKLLKLYNIEDDEEASHRSAEWSR